MRLWHQSLIPYLDRQRLFGAHRECCALRGRGWGKKHATVDYVFTHCPEMLVAYHWLIMDEMKRRNYNPNDIWYNCDYRGTTLGEEKGWCDFHKVAGFASAANRCKTMIYPEHNDAYLQECIENLKQKGIEIKYD
jgi:uncharacterized protein (TIGR02328 family)